MLGLFNQFTEELPKILHFDVCSIIALHSLLCLDIIYLPVPFLFFSPHPCVSDCCCYDNDFLLVFSFGKDLFQKDLFNSSHLIDNQ